jgi:predicted dienelactone hydrolase
MNRRLRFFCLWIALFAFASTAGALSKPSPLTAEHIGVRTLKFLDEDRNRPVIVELWYPTDQTGEWVEEESVWIHPKELRNSPLSTLRDRYPLIVMSHGHRGDRRERTWLAEHLAKKGFAVAAVEHYGNTFANYNPLISLRFWERPLDISFALDRLFEEPFLKERLDPSKIGFVGYSLGGMTGLALGGAIAHNVKEIVLGQQAENKEVTSDIVSQIDFSPSEREYAEPRIKAMLLICPATYVYSQQTLKKIKIPTALVASVDDEVLPHQEHALRILRCLNSTKSQLMKKKTSHYSFLNRVSDLGKRTLHKNAHNDPPGCDRLLLHNEVGCFAAKFFQELFY